MKILILNGNPGSPEFDAYIGSFKRRLEKEGKQVDEIRIREMKVISCTGCWGCWVKNPGRCSFDDDTGQIRHAIIHSDLLIFASPLIMGFVSAELKLVMDKLIPLLLPYIQLIQGESHHEKRYEKYPKLGLLLGKGPNADDEDVDISREIFERFSLNFHSKLLFTKTTEQTEEELIHEINSY